MPVRKANQPRFLFFCGELETSTFGVINFSGRDTISSPYEFSINLKSDRADISAEEMVNKQATLFMLREHEYYLYSGVVLEFVYVETNVDFSLYNVILTPKLRLLDFNFQSRVFQKMSVPDIIKEVLDEANLSDYYKTDIQGSYPERESVIQYQESDLNFISRLMEEAGIWYFFKELPILPEEVESVNSEMLVISDRPASFQYVPGESEIIYRSSSGLHEWAEDGEMECVSRLRYEKRIVSKNVLVKNYNYRTPEVDLSAGKSVSSGIVGTIYSYGNEFKDVDSAEKTAEILANRIALNQTDIVGCSNCCGFRAGMRFSLSEHERKDCNDKYLLRSVIHSGSHSSMEDMPTSYSYSNDFTSVPSSMINIFKPLCVTKIPKINGVITATVEANGSDYASLDEMARYKVRMPFDISESDNYNASKYIRLAQPYSGSDYGIHFPSHEGAEMVLACIEGNPNKPVGVGMIPNANTVSPVVSNNKTQNIIRTAGKNEILLDDAAEKQKIRIVTAAKNTVEFDDENRRIFLQTTDNNKFLFDDANEKVSCNAKDHNITMNYKGGEEGIVITTCGGHVIKIDDANKSLTIQTKAGHIMEMDDNGKSITLSDCKGKNTVTLDGNKGLILDSKGEVSIKAMKNVNIEGQNVNISTTTGKIEAKATQDLNLSGMKINEKATMDFNMEGMNANIKAQMNSKIEANLGIEIKSSLQTKIGGTITDLSGDAMTSVKGGVVMIN